jgi:hypothetical protein
MARSYYQILFVFIVNSYLSNQVDNGPERNNYIGPVLRIRAILVWIRIRIRVSKPLTNGFFQAFITF